MEELWTSKRESKKLEARLDAMIARRKALIPKDFDFDPIVQSRVRELMSSMAGKIRRNIEDEKEQKIRENSLDAAMHEAVEKTMREHDEKETLELVQALELYEKTGVVPEGWEIEDQTSVTQ